MIEDNEFDVTIDGNFRGKISAGTDNTINGVKHPEPFIEGYITPLIKTESKKENDTPANSNFVNLERETVESAEETVTIKQCERCTFTLTNATEVSITDGERNSLFINTTKDDSRTSSPDLKVKISNTSRVDNLQIHSPKEVILSEVERLGEGKISEIHDPEHVVIQQCQRIEVLDIYNPKKLSITDCSNCNITIFTSIDPENIILERSNNQNVTITCVNPENDDEWDWPPSDGTEADDNGDDMDEIAAGVFLKKGAKVIGSTIVGLDGKQKKF